MLGVFSVWRSCYIGFFSYDCLLLRFHMYDSKDWAMSISRVRVLYVWNSWLVTDWPLCSICSTYGCHNNGYMILLLFIGEKRCRQTMRTVRFDVHAICYRNKKKKTNWWNLLELNWKSSKNCCSQTPWSDNMSHTLQILFSLFGLNESLFACTAQQSDGEHFWVFIFFIYEPDMWVQREQEHNRTNMNTLKMKYLVRFDEASAEFSLPNQVTSNRRRRRRLLPDRL